LFINLLTVNIETKRNKLYDYIRFADDKKVKEIYTLVKDDIGEEIDPWQEESFVKELDRRLKDIESGKTKGVSWEEVKLKARGKSNIQK